MGILEHRGEGRRGGCTGTNASFGESDRGSINLVEFFSNMILTVFFVPGLDSPNRLRQLLFNAFPSRLVLTSEPFTGNTVASSGIGV